MSFLAELRRRNVYRVAALYIIVSWLVLQVTDVVSSVLALPAWTGKLVFLLLAIGLPVALVLAWAFELTPDGLKRERDLEEGDQVRGGKRSRLDFVILALLLAALGYFAWQHDWGNGPRDEIAPEIRSIAVLPLENLMNDPGQAFFVAGMHEALITELSKIDALRVISRTSAMRFQDSDKTVPQIARELGVEAVIEGSVLKAGNTVRITVQLIEAETDRHIWAENFDRELSDILALYSDVTREITSQIRLTLTEEDEAEIAAAGAVNPEVYELYLRGRFLCDNWSAEEMERGIRLLQEAVSLEPGNAQAHSQLALCLQYAAFFGYEKPLDVYQRSRAAAAMAVQLDDESAEAHAALAGVQYYLEFDTTTALKSLNRALDRDPSSVRALLHISWLLAEAGHYEPALEYGRRALNLDPLSTAVNDAVGQAHYLHREYELAIAAYRKALDLDRSDPSLHYHLAWPHEQLGRFEQAIELHRAAVQLSGGFPLYRAALAYAYGLAGMREEAAAILESLRGDPAAAPYDLAIVHLGLGEHEPAIDQLELAFEARDSHLVYLNRDAKFDPLRSNPRFQAILEAFNYPAATDRQ